MFALLLVGKQCRMSSNLRTAYVAVGAGKAAEKLHFGNCASLQKILDTIPKFPISTKLNLLKRGIVSLPIYIFEIMSALNSTEEYNSFP